MEKMSCTNHVRNEVLQRVEEESDMLQTVKIRKAMWIGHILRRNCFLKHVIERKIQERSDGKTKKKTETATG